MLAALYQTVPVQLDRMPAQASLPRSVLQTAVVTQSPCTCLASLSVYYGISACGTQGQAHGRVLQPSVQVQQDKNVADCSSDPTRPPRLAVTALLVPLMWRALHTHMPAL